MTIQTILDWRPLTYFTIEVADLKRGTLGICTLELTAADHKTMVEERYKFPRGPRWLMRLGFTLMYSSGLKKSIATLQKMLKERSLQEHPVPS